MKKYMIRCDVEGVSGVVSYEQAEPGRSEFETGLAGFHSDLAALMDGLNAGGADEIHIYDEHFYGRNIDLGALPENAVAYCGKPPYLASWAGGLDESFTGLILLGFHSKRGTAGALLNHTYEPDIRDIRINGVSVGEIGVETAIAGDFGVPLLMVTADSEGVREAQELVDGVNCVSVKYSLSEFGACCLPLAVTHRIIYETAQRTARQTPLSAPYRVGENAHMEIDLFDTQFARDYHERFGKADFAASTVTECWAQYQKNKGKVASWL